MVEGESTRVWVCPLCYTDACLGAYASLLLAKGTGGATCVTHPTPAAGDCILSACQCVHVCWSRRASFSRLLQCATATTATQRPTTSHCIA
jgi:hypothetical protein